MDEKLYIGIDLGDRTYSMNGVKSSTNETIPIKLPGQTANAPILCAVGVREDGGCELLRREDSYSPSDYSHILVNFKRRPTSIGKDSPMMQNYRFGVKAMLQLTLTDENTARIIRDLANGCSEIVFCIGYPTNWSEQDVKIFRSVVGESVLGDTDRLRTLYGKPVRVQEERESAAAFIYTRANKDRFGIEKATKVLELDFGSSTINVTALTIGASETMYNSGHNYFGGRMVDCLIADYYMRQLSGKELALIEDLDRNNHGAATRLILLEACSAKEKLTTSTTVRIATDFIDRSISITREAYVSLLEQPMAPCVSRFSLLTDSELREFGNRSWREILVSYLKQEKEILAKKGIDPEMVIVTGGGALLPDIQDACQLIFANRLAADDETRKRTSWLGRLMNKITGSRDKQDKHISFLDAGEATSTISKGLAMAAKRVDRSADFNRAVKDFTERKLITLIKAEVPSLADKVCGGVTDLICEKAVIPRLLEWRSGEYSTLDSATNAIGRYCASDEFSKVVQNDPTIREAIKSWSEDSLGRSVAGELSSICRQYNVKGFALDTLNVLKTPAISIDGGAVVGGVYDLVGAVVAVVAGLIAASLSTSALIVVLEIVAVFLPGLALAIAEIVAAIPGGLVILAGIAGVGVFTLITRGWEAFRSEIINSISGAEIPVLMRKAVSENRIRSSVLSKKDDIKETIKDSISSKENADKIASQIKESIAKQISLKINDIRYALESA